MQPQRVRTPAPVLCFLPLQQPGRLWKSTLGVVKSSDARVLSIAQEIEISRNSTRVTAQVTGAAR
jgi:hypothetical protein